MYKHSSLFIDRVTDDEENRVSSAPDLVEAPLEVFRRHEVLGHLDAVVDVPNLKSRGNTV
jgi:hypothetical protein